MNGTPASGKYLGQMVLVEDDPAFRGILMLLFQSAGWKVVGAADGKIGLMLTRRLSPDVVVTDLRMPGMSGIQLAGEIVSSDGGGKTPVVAITSDASELRDAAVRSGLFVQVLTKPIAPDVLLQTVRQAIPAKPAE
jgi:CheY-like chemotaxis protein